MKSATYFPHYWKKEFLSKRVGIELHDDRCFKRFDALLSCFPQAETATEIHFKILPGDNSSLCLQDHMGNSWECSSWIEAYYKLECTFYERVLPLEKSCYIFHSAAVQHRPTGRVALLMGPSMSGKSSLTLCLLKSGKFDYVAEDAVGHHLETFETIPFTRPLRIRNGLDTLVSGVPGWKILKGPWPNLVYAIPPSVDLPKSRLLSPPALVLFPRFSTEGQNGFAAVGKAELLASLVTFCANEVSFFDKKRLAALADFARRTDAMRIVWNDPLDAAETITRLMESS